MAPSAPWLYLRQIPRIAVTLLVACGATAPAPAPAPALAPAPVAAPPAPDPDLHRLPPRRVLDIDWAKTSLTNQAEAAALWQRIAPTGRDWEDKLLEIPATHARPLAIAVLRGGNFTCTLPARGDCAKPAHEVESPAETAGWGDPCLRRMLALWAIAQLEEADLPEVAEALRAIAAIPPPESQLVAAALHAYPDSQPDARLELIGIAARAGQHDLADEAIAGLDQDHLIQAARQHRIAGALEVLSAEGHRAVYLAAVTDEAMAPRARIAAIEELVELDGAAGARPPRDLQAALVVAANAKDCSVAAAAARALDQRGDHRFVPRRPRTTRAAALMRALCVLASYEALQRSDEPSLLASYLPARGLERVVIAHDPLSETDEDGDGDPHTTRTAELVPREDAVLPELDDVVRAMRHCTGTICVSDDRELRFVLGPAGAAGRPGGELVLRRIELADRPPCPDRAPQKP